MAAPATADVPIRALEQLANAEARWGATLARTAPQQKTSAARNRDLKRGLYLIDSAKRRIKSLIEMEPTGERLSLHASACKRGVLADLTAPQCRHALREMQQAYRAAADHKIREQESDAYYPVIGWMDATLLLGDAPKQKTPFAQAVREAR